MSHSQFHIHLYLDMHGLVFETSIWLLAGSTRLHGGGISAAEANWILPRGLQNLQSLQFEKLHLNISSPIRRMIHALMISIPKNETPTWKIIRTDDNDQQSLLSHRPYVDSFRNMYKMQLHENLVSGLSSLGAESTRLNDFTSPVGQMLRPLKSSRYQDRILDHTRAGRRCFQISSSRGLTPLGSTDTWVLPISM